ARVATTDNDEARKTAEARFWVLYWGPLAAVEDVTLLKQSESRVESAMMEFGDLLEKPPKDRDPKELRRSSLRLAQAVRKAIQPAFDVKAPDPTERRTKRGSHK